MDVANVDIIVFIFFCYKLLKDAVLRSIYLLIKSTNITVMASYKHFLQ